MYEEEDDGSTRTLVCANSTRPDRKASKSFCALVDGNEEQNGGTNAVGSGCSSVSSKG